jgi:hypothetical protein
MKKPSINPDFFDFLRLRNVYDLHLEQLTVEPGDTPPAGETVEVQPLTDETTKIDRKGPPADLFLRLAPWGFGIGQGVEHQLAPGDLVEEVPGSHVSFVAPAWPCLAQ